MLDNLDGHLPVLILQVQADVDCPESTLAYLPIRDLIVSDGFGLHLVLTYYKRNTLRQGFM